MKLILAALALSLPGQAPALPTLAVAPANDAGQLARLLVPERAMLDLIMVAIRNEAKRRPPFAGDPAMTDFVLKRMQPDILQMVREAVPELRVELTKIFSTEMTPGEIGDVYAFFASPAGQRLQQIGFEVVAENPSADSAEHQRIAVERFTASITPADIPALTAFGSSAGARKMKTVAPKTTAASEAWAQRVIARHGTRIDAIRTQAIADYRKQKGIGQ
jgi:hypothetical protein